MSVLPFLILASLGLGVGFLVGFIWAVRSGQYEDTGTPAMRILFEEGTGPGRLPGRGVERGPDPSGPAKPRPSEPETK